MEDAKAVLSAASKMNGKPIEPEQVTSLFRTTLAPNVHVLDDKMLQIVLTKPSAAAAAGSFLDIMRHPTLRIHTLIM